MKVFIKFISSSSSSFSSFGSRDGGVGDPGFSFDDMTNSVFEANNGLPLERKWEGCREKVFRYL